MERGYRVSYVGSLDLYPTLRQEGSGLSHDYEGNPRLGHSDFAAPSALHQSLVESLHTPKDQRLGETRFPVARYCGARQLLARADTQNQALP